MSSSISFTAVDRIQQVIDAAVANPTSNIPGVSVVVTNRQGQLLVNAVAGLQGLQKGAGPLQKDAIYWLASCTKISSSVLALIAVEEGKVSLDDPKVVEKLCPELRKIPIIKSVNSETGEITLVPKKNKITLRSLLIHTAGFSYTHLNPELAKYGRIFGIHEGTGLDSSVLQPLVAEPGTRFSYGIGVDWACNVICRAYGKTLDTLMKEKIFTPLGMKDTSFIPTQSMKDRTVTVSFRKPSGDLVPTPRLTNRAQATDAEYAAAGYQYGGAGLYSNPIEYSKLFATLLNGGVSPHTGARILSQKSVDEMFTNQLPDWPNFGRDFPMTSYIPSVSNSLPEIYPQRGNPPQGWGLSFFLNLVPMPSGRSSFSAYWCGITNLYYFIDREKDVAAFISCQILPSADFKTLKLVSDLEKEIYKGLKPSSKL